MANQHTASPMPDRFWEKVEKIVDRCDPMGGCWVWKGALAGHAPNNYGDFGVGSRTRRAHRVSWELANGPIPDGVKVLHRCDNPPCVRPTHLFLGTVADNSADMIAKGRSPRGARHPVTRLTEAQVATIRGSAVPASALARMFGIHPSYVSQIRSRKRWSWLP